MDNTKYTTNDANKMDREARNLTSLYSKVRIKAGLELARRLYNIESNKLYLRIDEKAYPNFPAYISSLGISYQPCRELIGIYQTFVLAAGYSVDNLAEISYHKLAVIKPELFDKKDGQYIMSKSRAETNSWVADAKSNMSINDLKQKRRETAIGEHDHKFEIITFKKCIHCGLRVKY